MSNANIPVSGTTALLQTYRNTIGGVAVDSEAVTLTDENGAPMGVIANPVFITPSGTVTVNGTVASTQSGSWTVGINNFPATQPVSGTVAATQSGSWTVAATQSGTWTATVSGSVGTTASSINVGQKTSNTSAVQLTASSIVPTNGMIIQALSGNVASVFIGGSGVTTSTGFELQAGQAMSLTPTNANLVYVIGANNTDGVCWNAM